MTKDFGSELLDVGRSHKGTPLKEGVGAGGPGEVDSGPGGGSGHDEILQGTFVVPRSPGGLHKVDDVSANG